MLILCETSFWSSDLAWSFIGLVMGWALGFVLGYWAGVKKEKKNHES